MEGHRFYLYRYYIGLPSVLLVIRYDKFILRNYLVTSLSLLVKLFFFSVLLLCFLETVMVNKDEYIQ